MTPEAQLAAIAESLRRERAKTRRLRATIRAIGASVEHTLLLADDANYGLACALLPELESAVDYAREVGKHLP